MICTSWSNSTLEISKEEGIVICVNDEQFLKEESLIEVTEEGKSNVIFVNEEHSEKV